MRQRDAREEAKANPQNFKGQAHNAMVDLTVQLMESDDLDSIEAVQAFFAAVHADAKKRYADAHSNEIFAAFREALPKAAAAAKADLEKKQRSLDALKNLLKKK